MTERKEVNNCWHNPRKEKLSIFKIQNMIAKLSLSNWMREKEETIMRIILMSLLLQSEVRAYSDVCDKKWYIIYIYQLIKLFSYLVSH